MLVTVACKDTLLPVLIATAADGVAGVVYVTLEYVQALVPALFFNLTAA